MSAHCTVDPWIRRCKGHKTITHAWEEGEPGDEARTSTVLLLLYGSPEVSSIAVYHLGHFHSTPILPFWDQSILHSTSILCMRVNLSHVRNVTRQYQVWMSDAVQVIRYTLCACCAIHACVTSTVHDHVSSVRQCVFGQVQHRDDGSSVENGPSA